MVGTEPSNKMSVTSWFLVSSSGMRHRLPREMIFVGRDDCELMLQSRSVDKQHAVINYDSEKDEHRVKDLGSLNGTFVNDVRIPDQKYITLKLNDAIRFGYDINMYVLEQIQHKVPEEALKHEKYTSQLQMNLKTSVNMRKEQLKEQASHVDSSPGKQEKVEKKPPSEPSIYRTPLYGQPSWWGDEDENNMHEKHEGRRPEDHFPERPKGMPPHEDEMNCNVGYRDPSDQSLYSFRREPSYFEIPTKDFQQPAKTPEAQVHEIPTKDTDTVTPPVVQSHASFTIEFDDCRPGKIKIKDHVTKFSLRQRKAGKETAPTEMMSVESKVADWLVHNDPSLIRRPSPGEDVYSTKSDLPIHNRTLKGNRHEDGTQSDSEDQPVAVPEKESVPTPVDQGKLQRQIKREPEELLHNQQAFVIEFFDDDAPRKKRSQSFTHSANGSQTDGDSKGKNDKRKAALPPEKPNTNGTSPPPSLTKPPTNSSFPQRSNSFRREKTDDRINTSTPITAKPPSKNFGSIGKKSKLAQEFASEFLREEAAEAAARKTIEPPTSLPLLSGIMQQITKPMESTTVVPSLPPAPDHNPVQGKRNEEEDSLSDAGTYTIETENQDKEVEEARRRIDEVFGVFDPEEYSMISSSVYRPIIKLEKEEPSMKDLSVNHKAMMLSLTPTSKAFTGSQADGQPAKSSASNAKSGQKWVSRWASLADSYPDASPTSPLEGQRLELTVDNGHNTDLAEIFGDGDTSFPSRTRRLLPQLPPNDKSESPTPIILVRTESSSEVPQKIAIHGDKKTAPAEQNCFLNIQEDLDPDSLSDASKSDDGVLSSRKSNPSPNASRSVWRRDDLSSHEQSVQRTNKAPTELKSTSFYVGSDNEIGSLPHANAALPVVDIPKEYKGHEVQVKLKGNQHQPPELMSAGRMANQLLKKDDGSPEESASFVRQESFTKEKSSSNISPNKLPQISTHPLLKDLTVTKPTTDYSIETRLILKETETALAALEAKLFSQNHLEGIDSVECPPDDSLSGDSDVDTASTVSLVSDQNVPSHPPKNRIVGLHKEKSSSASSIQDHYNQPTARERLSEKRKTGVADTGTRRDATKRFEMKRSTGPRGSLDFTDEERSSSLPYIPTDTVSSDYEHSSSRNLSRRRPYAQSSKEDANRISSNAQKVQQALTRSNSLSTPRPTRASKLRRARLGEASDNESADAERLNSPDVSSANSSSAKSSSESKKLSRLDYLAMPRKRTGSFNVPSDSEVSSSRTGFSGRSADQGYTSRKPAMAEVKQPIKKPVAPVPKQPLTRARSGSVKYSSTSASRRRQQGSDYLSTSEEEYGSNHSTPKHKRSHTSTATQTPKATTIISHSQRHNRLQDDDDDDQEVYSNFMAQSAEIAEIARLSQTLVKDVASLAKEIHEVAGDGDSQSSSGTGHSTSISSVPNTPASIISAREELVHHIPEASLNYQKIPPGYTGSGFDQNMNDNREEDPLKRRARNREEVIFDNLMLNPVSQLSHTICSNTEILTKKMKILFKNKDKSWEDIEAKIHSENEVPILKTSNKEISSILKELRRVQKQLEVINAIIDPAGHLEVVSSNKKVSPALQSTMPQIRTNSSLLGIESNQPVHVRNYLQKSSSGSSRSPESSFGRDEDGAYIV
ncbi:centrosomal protein of 170 kDa protein B isoform X2 [Rana temporaria]|uniref:centrosomal protein of 170 kDa protein B isoform X2 n=1 Tax=Rana temporaria TaxID=8407 RepID=UPI001AAC6571|nr:centrosomal protein of 170 kDa protein B isoform X2 [Rana temporaria]